MGPRMRESHLFTPSRVHATLSSLFCLALEIPHLESERRSDGGDDLGDDAVEVGVRRVVVMEVNTTHLVDRLRHSRLKRTCIF